MNSQFEIELNNHLKSFTTSPYLFIGSGLSSRYIKTDNWKSLLENVCKQLMLPYGFFYYNAKANGDLSKVATLMGEDLFEIWWKEERFAKSREKFSDKAIDKESPLKFEICEFLQKNLYLISPEIEAEYNLFKKINVEGIITTNWDSLLEKSFPEFASYVGQNKLIFNNSINVGEIYKIHGCATDPTSLVVTEADYNAFHKKNPYLAAKLLTIFMEHPILFMGYNIGDSTIHLILNSIINILDRNNISSLKDRLIFCERDNSIKNCTISDGNILISGLNLPIKQIKYKSLESVYNVLTQNNKRLPIKILRHMKNMVYDFVKNSNSKTNVYLADESNIDNLDLNKVQFVYGFGIKESLSSVGIKGISSKDLLIDIIEKNLQFEPISISRKALPDIIGKYIPYFKYLRLANLLDEEGKLPISEKAGEFTTEFVEKINSINHEHFYPAGSYLLKKNEINSKYSSISELVAKETPQHSMIFIPLLDIDKVKLEEMYSFLKGVKIDKNSIKTEERKLICLYDYLKYKLQK